MILDLQLAKLFGWRNVTLFDPTGSPANGSNIQEAANFDVIQDRTLVGVELEFENYRRSISDLPMLALIEHFWEFKSDGSLRNKGIELVSHLGLTANEVNTGLTLLSNALKTTELKAIEATARCGYHVHLNFKCETVATLQKMILVYGIFEQFLFSISGNRGKNINCVPLLDLHESRIFSRFLDTPHKINAVELSEVISSISKYCAFNLGALHQHGTIEFRHHEGTKDMGVVLCWLQLLLDLLTYARNTTEQHIKHTLYELNTTSQYRQFLYEVFPSITDMPHLQTGVSNLKNNIRENVASVKELLLLHQQEENMPRDDQNFIINPPPIGSRVRVETLPNSIVWDTTLVEQTIQGGWGIPLNPDPNHF